MFFYQPENEHNLFRTCTILINGQNYQFIIDDINTQSCSEIYDYNQRISLWKFYLRLSYSIIGPV